MAFYRITIVAIVLTLVVILLGAYVRLADAGLGCPDWPGCYGQLVVPNEAHEIAAANQAFPKNDVDVHKAWKEMIHRYVASTLGLLILIMALLSLRRAATPRVPRVLPWVLLAFVIFQGLLGMWTVTLLLKPLIVTLHLLGGMTILALLAWCLMRYRSIAADWRVTGHGWLRAAAGAALVLLAIQIFLGAWTSTNYAGMACPDFPTCQGYWWPPMNFAKAFTLWHGLPVNYQHGILNNVARMTIHWTHRLGAMAVAVALALLVALLWWHGRADVRWRYAALLLLAAVSLQIVLGISVVVFGLPLYVTAAHTGGAALLVLALVLINHAVWSAQEHERSR